MGKKSILSSDHTGALLGMSVFFAILLTVALYFIPIRVRTYEHYGPPQQGHISSKTEYGFPFPVRSTVTRHGSSEIEEGSSVYKGQFTVLNVAALSVVIFLILLIHDSIRARRKKKEVPQ